jgi:hypothetical protein
MSRFASGGIHLFRKVPGIPGVFQLMAWTGSESLHRWIFHKKNDGSLAPARVHMIWRYFAQLTDSENAHKFGLRLSLAADQSCLSSRVFFAERLICLSLPQWVLSDSINRPGKR